MNSKPVSHPSIDYLQILDHTRDAVIILRGTQIIFSNRSAAILLSDDSSVSINDRSFPSFLSTEDITLFEEKLHRLLFAKEDDPLLYLSVHSSPNHIKPVEATVHLLPADAETLIQLTLRDISDRKATEQSLMQSEKLSVIGELAASILHEIKNPLTSIKGFLQLMQNEQGNNRAYIDIILSEVEHIEKIAGELLYFTKPKAVHFAPQDLVEIVKETFFLFNAQAARKDVVLQLITGGRPHVISGDRTQLKQVTVNLLKNAIEATACGGKVSVTLSARENCEQMIVRDSGKGIPQALIGQLGKSFFTTKETGTGLGLMVTYNIVRQHRGRIDVVSDENKGTTFTIRFPAAKKSS